MQTRPALWIAVSLTCLTLAACGDTADQAESVSDVSSVVAAALGTTDATAALRAASRVEFNAMEIARLALHRSHDTRVLKFARAMLDDHTHNRSRLRQAANRYGLQVATTMDTQGQTAWSALFVQSGATFDRAFGEAVARLQALGLKQVAALAETSTDEDVAAWCAGATELWQAERDRLAAM